MRFLRKISILKTIFFLLCSTASVTFSQSRVTYFSALPLTDSVRLSFSIAPGNSCGGYTVYKGSDSSNFQPLYVYPGICGNTSYAEGYKYIDYSPNKTTANYYRIFLPPGDYSKVLKVDLAVNYSNLLVFPQPTEDILNISVSDKKNFYYELSIYDRYGRKRGFTNGNAYDKITLNVSGLPEGVYVFYFVDGSGDARRGKFLKTN